MVGSAPVLVFIGFESFGPSKIGRLRGRGTGKAEVGPILLIPAGRVIYGTR